MKNDHRRSWFSTQKINDEPNRETGDGRRWILCGMHGREWDNAENPKAKMNYDSSCGNWKEKEQRVRMEWKPRKQIINYHRCDPGAFISIVISISSIASAQFFDTRTRCKDGLILTLSALNSMPIGIQIVDQEQKKIITSRRLFFHQ